MYRSDTLIDKSFNPVNYTFEWTGDDEFGWYKWDYEKAHKQAKAARLAERKRLKKEGWTVKFGTHPNSRMKLGGIGSGRPEIDLVVTVYYLTATKS